jgi:hypothetical protein
VKFIFSFLIVVLLSVTSVTAAVNSKELKFGRIRATGDHSFWPVMFHDFNGPYTALTLKVQYDSKLLKYIGVTRPSDRSNVLMAANGNKPGEVAVAWAQTDAMKNGELLAFEFQKLSGAHVSNGSVHFTEATLE